MAIRIINQLLSRESTKIIQSFPLAQTHVRKHQCPSTQYPKIKKIGIPLCRFRQPSYYFATASSKRKRTIGSQVGSEVSVLRDFCRLIYPGKHLPIMHELQAGAKWRGLQYDPLPSKQTPYLARKHLREQEGKITSSSQNFAFASDRCRKLLGGFSLRPCAWSVFWIRHRASG